MDLGIYDHSFYDLNGKLVMTFKADKVVKSRLPPLCSVRQNFAGFRRGLFTCFLGHTPLLQYYLLFGPHHLITVIKNQ